MAFFLIMGSEKAGGQNCKIKTPVTPFHIIICLFFIFLNLHLLFTQSALASAQNVQVENMVYDGAVESKIKLAEEIEKKSAKNRL